MPDLVLPDPARAAALDPARRALRETLQPAAALGVAHGEPALAWSPTLRALVGPEVDGVRAGVVVPTFTWVVVNARGRVAARFDAAGQSVSSGLRWMAEAVEAQGGPGGALVAGPWFQGPPDGTDDGSAVLEAPDPSDLEELARWYGLAHAVLARLGAARPGTTSPGVAAADGTLSVTVPSGATLSLCLGSDALSMPHAVVAVAGGAMPAVTLPLGAVQEGRAVLRGAAISGHAEIQLAAFFGAALAALEGDT